MEPKPQEQGHAPVVKSTSSNLIKYILICAIVFFIGIMLGMLLQETVPFLQDKDQVATSVEKTIDEQINLDPKNSVLIDPTAILINRVFTEWLGSVEGKLVDKDSESITIEREGQTLKIYLQENLTLFMNEAKDSGRRPDNTTLDKIPIGSYLRGGVTISRGTLTGEADQHIIANGFTVIKKENIPK